MLCMRLCEDFFAPDNPMTVPSLVCRPVRPWGVFVAGEVRCGLGHCCYSVGLCVVVAAAGCRSATDWFEILAWVRR